MGNGPLQLYGGLTRCRAPSSNTFTCTESEEEGFDSSVEGWNMGTHILFQTGIRRLGSKEKGFFYSYPGTEETVREERVLTRIENLKVPPAWEEARVARSPSAKVQAIGYDSAGRLQYLYHPNYRERKEREKFERILD